MLIRLNPLSSLCLLASLSLASPLTYAAEEQHPLDKEYQACTTKNYSTLGMIECSAQAEKKWDAELNKVYRALSSKLNPEGKKQLKKSQRQWLKYRDSEFETIVTIYGAMEGTMWRVIASSDRVEVVKQRVLTLQGYLAAFTVY